MFSWRRSSGKAASTAVEQAPSFARRLECARAGEPEALSALYQQFLPGVFGTIAARVPDRATAEDLTAEVFLKMVEGISQVRATDEAGFAGWIMQIARITIAGFYRKRHYQLEVVPLELSSGEDDEPGEHQSIPASHPDYDPVRKSEGREEWQRVRAALSQLTEEQQQVITYRLILGYDVATVARMLGKNPNAIKALQFRALHSLERLLATPTSIAQPPRSHLRRQEGGL